MRLAEMSAIVGCISACESVVLVPNLSELKRLTILFQVSILAILGFLLL